MHLLRLLRMEEIAGLPPQRSPTREEHAVNEDFDFTPAMRPRAAGVIGAHVALEMRHGRSLSDAMSDQLVQLDYDEHPFLLDELAADPEVRGALAA